MSKVVYENPFAYESDIRDFILEGKANISFDNGAMKIDSKNLSPEDQKDGCVLWCPMSFPSDVKIEWAFRPLLRQPLHRPGRSRESGLHMRR